MEEPKASTVTEVKPAPSEAVVESDDGKPKPNPTTQSDKETSDSSPKYTSVVSTPWRTHRRSSEEESPMSESLFQNETSQNGSTQSDLLVLKDTSAPKTLLPEVAPTDLAPIDRWVEQPKSQSPSLHPADQLRVLAKNGPLVFLNAEARRQLLTELIRPRPLAEDVTDILELIKKIAQPTKGLDSWLDQFAQVDLKGMDTYERKKILRNIEENWLEELLVHEAQKPILLPADRGWHGDYGLECGGGANPQAVGDHPLRSSGASSMWLSQQLDLDYRVNPVGPWSYNYGLQFNHVFSTGSSQDDGSWSGLGCNFKSTREINQQGLAAISPYVVFNRADSFLVDHGQLRQNLYLAGMSFNWAELHLSGAFEKCVGTTDVFIDKVQPLGHTNRHFVDGRHLSQSAWGLRHTQNWLKANAEGQEGPGLELAIVERNGDHPAATGLELGTGVLWQYQRQHWGYQSGLSLNYWGRDEAVTSWVLHGRLEGQLFPKGLNYAELSFENSSSSDPIMDYTSTRLALGWGIKW